MLTKDTRDAIADFRQSLETLQATLTSDQPEVEPVTRAFGEVQEQFKTRITTLGDRESDDPHLQSQLQSYITETHKQMRLLGLDLRFLQASRQSATARDRLAQVRDRISILIGYSTALLENTEGE
ncbi:MAG: heterocyst frequency control protein PatD [Limnospira sp.]